MRSNLAETRLRALRGLLVILLGGAAFASIASGKTAGDGGSASFSVVADLSAAAQEKLAASGGKEKIVIDAFWFGVPAPGAESQANEFGQIELGLARQPIDIGVPVQIVGAGVDMSKLGLLKDRSVKLALSAWSAGRALPKSFLFCAALSLTLAEARAKPVQVHCETHDEWFGRASAARSNPPPAR